jgi:hypothetical protein
MRVTMLCSEHLVNSDTENHTSTYMTIMVLLKVSLVCLALHDKLATQVWNAVRNDGTPYRNKFLGITPQKIKIVILVNNMMHIMLNCAMISVSIHLPTDVQPWISGLCPIHH